MTVVPSVGATLVLASCRSATAMLDSVARAGGLDRPYVASGFVDADPATARAALLDALANRNAMILCEDPASGCLSWTARGSGFVALESSSVTADVPGWPSRHRLSEWSGTILGGARIRSEGGRTRVHLHAIARAIGRPVFVHSDGSYERHLLADVRRAVRAGRPLAVPPRAPSIPTRRGGRDYSLAYFQSFAGYRPPSLGVVRAVARAEVYPVGLDAFWEACLDVVHQYDALVDLSRERRRIAFVHGMRLPSGSGDDLAYSEALIVLYATPRGESGTAVHLAWIPPGESEPEALEPLDETDEKELTRRAAEQPHGTVAALAAQQLLGHVSTQVFCEERWTEKLERRSGESRRGPRSRSR